MLIVAGLSLKNLHPRVWDPDSPYHLPALRAVMVSYADFHRMPPRRKRAMEEGLGRYLGTPERIRIYLDNGAFYFLAGEEQRPLAEYEAFVAAARPDWYPIPQDYIPLPAMTPEHRAACFVQTMAMNNAYTHNGYVPVVHIGDHLEKYSAAIAADERLMGKEAIALGGIVPNLLRATKALPYDQILGGLTHLRAAFAGKSLHVFGIGGTATLHVAALLSVDSVDSSGWRNRAARGLIQLPGSGDRTITKLGNWRGREPDAAELGRLTICPCPACCLFGLEGLRASGLAGFCNRATHNLWVLLEEGRLIEEHLADETYAAWYPDHLDNSIYRPLIARLVEGIGEEQQGGTRLATFPGSTALPPVP